MFPGADRDHSEVSSLRRFHVSLWALILKAFYNYSLENIVRT